MDRPVRELKGVGEKTEKLLAKVGVTTVQDLLSYYPKNYDAYEEPIPIAQLKEGDVAAVRVTVVSGVYSNKVRNLQVITVTVADQTGKLPVAWFNAPYLKTMLKKGSCLVLRGKVAKKQGRLEMEHPEVFTSAGYEEISGQLLQ